MIKARETLFGIVINHKLIWDYDWSEDEIKTEKFLKWYLSRIISVGSAKDLKQINFELIKKYFDCLIGVPSTVKNFWEWYLGTMRK